MASAPSLTPYPPTPLLGRSPHPLLAHHLIHLPQIVEAHLRLWHLAEPRPDLSSFEIPQQSVAYPAPRHPSNLLLDSPHRFHRPFSGTRFQEHRVNSREPSYRPCHV